MLTHFSWSWFHERFFQQQLVWEATKTYLKDIEDVSTSPNYPCHSCSHFDIRCWEILLTRKSKAQKHKEYSITLPLTQWKPKLGPIEFLVETSILSKFDIRLHVLISAIREAQRNTGSRDARYVLISQGKPSKDICDKIIYFLHFAPDPCSLIERMKEPLSSLSLIVLLVPSTKIFHMDVSYFLGQFYRKPSLIILNSRHLHLRGNMIWTHQQMQQENKMAAKNWIPTYQTTILFVFTSCPPPMSSEVALPCAALQRGLTHRRVDEETQSSKISLTTRFGYLIATNNTNASR